MPYSQHALGIDPRASVVLRVFEPSGPPKGSIIVTTAMGVAQSIYSRFAEWLATQGYFVTTFDYRGIGASAPPSLRGFHVNRAQPGRAGNRSHPQSSAHRSSDRRCRRQRLLARERVAHAAVRALAV